MGKPKPTAEEQMAALKKLRNELMREELLRDPDARPKRRRNRNPQDVWVKEPGQLWHGQDPSKSVHTVSGGLPTLGKGHR